MKRLVLMRGLPGSGKSTLAKSLGGIILSTDDYWSQDGEYRIDLGKLQEAHEWNQQRTRQAMEAKAEIIVIDNVNARAIHMQPYRDMASEFGYTVECMSPQTPWAWDVKECARRNTHCVPQSVIQAMYDVWED